MIFPFQAYHESGNMQVIEVNCFEAYSPKGHYLYLTTSTEDPSVDTYMIFTVRTNVFVDEINYLVSCQSIDHSKSDKDLCEHMYNKKMHSSRMRTACCSTRH